MLAVDRELDIAALEKAFSQHRGIGAKIGAPLRIADRDFPEGVGAEKSSFCSSSISARKRSGDRSLSPAARQRLYQEATLFRKLFIMNASPFTALSTSRDRCVFACRTFTFCMAASTDLIDQT
jgi:hypothetical protein